MSFFSRLSDIITSNLNQLLEKAENPQQTLAEIVQEMEAGVESAKRSAASALANARRIKTEMDEYHQKMVFWDQKAQEAVALGRDDLARRALKRRYELADLSGALKQQYDSTLTTVENLKTTLRAVEARLAEATRRQVEYVQGKVQEVAAQLLAKPAEQSPSADRNARISQLEREIASAEAEIVSATATAAVEAHLEQARREMEDRRDLEAELNQLKRNAEASNK